MLTDLLIPNSYRTYSIKNKLLLIIAVLFITSCTQTPKNNHQTSTEIKVLPEYVFSPTDNLSLQVEQTIVSAKNQNKKALLVLGAQWCHDSKGLAENFSTPEMQKILIAGYQVLFIDIGYLEKGFDVVQQFNLPIYYGTPTVMVVDPNSLNIVNRASMQKWLSADKVPLTEFVEYFDSFLSTNNALIETNQDMRTYLSQINEFEQQQAVKLKAAYAVIGPLLKKDINDKNKKGSAEFYAMWQQVRDFRYRIQDDIQALIAQAKGNVETGSSAPLILPTYPEFTWQ